MASNDPLQDFQDAIESASRWHKRTPVEQAEHDRASAGAFPGGPFLRVNDWVLHPDFGRCQVLAIEPPSVHLADKLGRAIELRQDAAEFTPDSIESGKVRVFSMSPKARL